MYAATFIFRKKQFDDTFHQLDAQIATIAKQIKGYVGEESWENPANGHIANTYYWESMEALQQLVKHPHHLQAKEQQAAWLDGYEVVIYQVLQRYGDNTLEHPLAHWKGAAMNTALETQIAHYEHKLAFEMDSADIKVALDNGENLVIVDARSSDAFAAEHIPGAISLPHRLMDADSTRDLDKDTLYVTYCDGIGCNASTKGALKLAKLGFKVKELIGGIDWWKRDGYTVETGAACRIGCGCN